MTFETLDGQLVVLTLLAVAAFSVWVVIKDGRH